MADGELYHVLLIGCDQYPPGQRSLRGCVNDIDSVEDLLLRDPGVGVPAARLRIMRLAAPRQDMRSTSRLQAQTKQPTKANIVAALQLLAGPDVRSEDRVLIYYSGHGGQTQRRDRDGWFECLVPCDEKLLFDDELNPLIAAITRRTADVTIVLDCCHSAGATRDVFGEPEHGATRLAEIRAPLDEPAATVRSVQSDRAQTDRRLLHTVDPNYVVVAACQADEKAQEDALDGTTDHGFLTYSLLKTLQHMRADQRQQVRWADIWAQLLEEVNRAAAKTGRTAQHPWVIGRPERRVFGGRWEPQDAGFQIRSLADGTYAIEAGTLLGITVDAVLGVYGRVPAHFPALGSEADRRAQIGQVRVIQAERATCRAEVVVQQPLPVSLPRGARARLIQPGRSEQLRVELDRREPNPAPVLAESPVLQIREGSEQTPEVRVERTVEGWALSNDTNRAFARLRLPSSADASTIEAYHVALRHGLESYERYNRVLRLAKSCCDPGLDQKVLVTLHNCSDTALLQHVDPKRPALPELPRNVSRIYAVRTQTRYCIRLANLYWQTLTLNVFNCTAYGMVEFLGMVTIKREDVETLWLQGVQRSPFRALPDNPNVDTVDRIVAIATTREGTDLSGLALAQTVQQVIDQTLNPTRGDDDRGSGTTQQQQQVELWTAVTVPLKINAAS